MLGEFNWRLVLQARLGPMAAMVGTVGWGGDRYTLFEKIDSTGKGAKPVYMLVATTAWDTDADAQEFAELYQAGIFGTQGLTETTADLLTVQPLRTYKDRYTHTLISRLGKKVTIVIAPDAAIVQAWTGGK